MSEAKKGERVRPLGEFVWLKRIDPVKKTDGGLHIPDIAQEKRLKGTVMAVGPGRITDHGVLIPPRVKVGDTVILPYQRGADLLEKKPGERQDLLLRESELQGILEEG